MLWIVYNLIPKITFTINFLSNKNIDTNGDWKKICDAANLQKSNSYA